MPCPNCGSAIIVLHAAAPSDSFLSGGYPTREGAQLVASCDCGTWNLSGSVVLPERVA